MEQCSSIIQRRGMLTKASSFRVAVEVTLQVVLLCNNVEKKMAWINHILILILRYLDFWILDKAEKPYCHPQKKPCGGFIVVIVAPTSASSVEKCCTTRALYHLVAVELLDRGRISWYDC